MSTILKYHPPEHFDFTIETFDSVEQAQAVAQDLLAEGYTVEWGQPEDGVTPSHAAALEQLAEAHRLAEGYRASWVQERDRANRAEAEIATLRGNSTWASMPAIESAWEYWNDEMSWILHCVLTGLEKDGADVVFAEEDGTTQGFCEVAEYLIDRLQAIKTRRPKITFPKGELVSRAWLDKQRGPNPMEPSTVKAPE